MKNVLSVKKIASAALSVVSTTIVALSCMLVVGGCSSQSSYVKTENLKKYDTLIIRNVVVKDAELEDDSSSNMADFKAVQEQMQKTYSAIVEEYLKSQKVFNTIIVSDDPGEAQKYDNALVLQTKYDNIALGHQAIRILRYVTVGVPLFGRGIMKVEATGTLLDAKSGKVLATEKNDTNTSWDPRSLEDNLLKMTENLAHQYGEFVVDRVTSNEGLVLPENADRK